MGFWSHFPRFVGPGPYLAPKRWFWEGSILEVIFELLFELILDLVTELVLELVTELPF